MPQDHRLQLQRFELKYPISEELTGALRDFISCHLELDDYAASQPSLSYPVHSLYIDSDDLKTHRATVNGSKNRFKLRLRYYSADPESPVFFEVKRRMDNCILKQRCGVRREAVPLLLMGQLPDRELLVSREPRHWAALERFTCLMQQINARPKLHNAYQREAWVSPNDNSVRVTFDRQVSAEPFFRAEAVTEMKQPIRVFPGWLVLEIKFTTRFPNWLRELVQRFGLRQGSSAKYSRAVEVLGEHRFHNGSGSDLEGQALAERRQRL
jgi:SPX domain protein involved in polyphosphate accumulation